MKFRFSEVDAAINIGELVLATLAGVGLVLGPVLLKVLLGMVV